MSPIILGFILAYSASAAPSPGLQKAREQAERGHVDEALTTVNRALKASPDDLPLELAYQRLMIDAGRHEEMARVYRERWRHRGDASSWLLYAFSLTDEREAIAALEEGASRFPQDPELGAALIVVRAVQAIGDMRLDEAAKLLEGVRWPPALAADRAAVAGIMATAKADYPEAVESFKEVVEESPFDAQSHLMLAGAYVNLNQHKKALTSIDTSLRLRDSPEGRLAKGGTLIRLGANLAGAKEARAALEKRPVTLNDHFSLATALLMFGRLPEALKKTHYVLERSSAPAYKGLLIDLDLRVFGAEFAKKECDGLLERHPRSLALLRSCASACEAAGDCVTALSHHDRSLKLDPGNQDTLVMKGDLLYKMDMSEQAKDVLAEAIKRDPGNWMAHLSLAVGELGKGRRDEARRSVERTLKISPDSASARFLKGKILFLDGDKKRAESEFKKALESSWVNWLREMLEKQIEELKNPGGSSSSEPTATPARDVRGGTK